MSNGALFPPRGYDAAKKKLVWRKVLKSKSVARKRESTDGSFTLTKVFELVLECGHRAYRPGSTLRPPDRIACTQCKEAL